MQNKITASVSWSIALDEADRFELTGHETFVTTEYTVLVERVTDAKCYIDKKQVRGLCFTGRRVLKSGKDSYQSKSVDLPDGHELIPTEIAALAAQLRTRVAELRDLIDRHTIQHAQDPYAV